MLYQTELLKLVVPIILWVHKNASPRTISVYSLALLQCLHSFTTQEEFKSTKPQFRTRTL